MSDVLEPDDDIFRTLLDSVDFDEIPEAWEPYSELSLVELMDRLHEVTHELEETGEMLNPKSPDAIELSAIYHGLLLERKKRGL